MPKTPVYYYCNTAVPDGPDLYDLMATWPRHPWVGVLPDGLSQVCTIIHGSAYARTMRLLHPAKNATLEAIAEDASKLAVEWERLAAILEAYARTPGSPTAPTTTT